MKLAVVAIGGPHGSGKSSIAKKIAESDKRIKLFHYENGGLSVARNRGLAKASGEYIQFIDSDDLLPTNSLVEVMSLIVEHDLDICLGNASTLFDGVEKTPELENKYRYVRPNSLYHKVEEGPKIFSHLIDTHYHPSACLYVFKKSLLGEITFFPNIYHEDNIFTTQLLSSVKARRVMVAPAELYIRRVRPDSITTQVMNMKHVEGLLKGYTVLLNYFKSTECSDELYRKSLKIYLSRLIIRAARVHSEIYCRKKLKLFQFKASLIFECVKNPTVLFRLRVIYNIVFS